MTVVPFSVCRTRGIRVTDGVVYDLQEDDSGVSSRVFPRDRE